MRHSVHFSGCSKCRIHWLNRIGANKARKCRGRAATSSWDHPSSSDWWKHLLLQAEYVVPAFQYPNWQTGLVFLHMIENIWKAMSVNCGISVNWMNSGGLKRPFSGEVYQPEQPYQTKSKSSIVGHMHPKKDSTEREVFQKMHQKKCSLLLWKPPEIEALPMLEALESLDDCRMWPWIWNIVCNVLLFQSISLDLIQIRESMDCARCYKMKIKMLQDVGVWYQQDTIVTRHYVDPANHSPARHVCMFVVCRCMFNSLDSSRAAE